MLALIILCILFTWLLCAAVCIGIGSLFLHAIFQSSDLQTFQRSSLLHSFWTGIAIITAILQLYHFIRPIDVVAVLLLCGLALVGFLSNYAFRIPDPLVERTSLLRFSGVSAFQRSNDLPRSSGASTFRLSTFSFQLSTFLLLSLAAAIIAFPCSALGEHYDTGFYGAQAVRWFITYPLLPCLSLTLAAAPPRRATTTRGATPSGLAIAMLLFPLAVTFKIWSLIFASPGWPVAVLKAWSLRRNAPQVKRQLMWAVILSGVIVLPWMGRGLVLTGYPFFPSTAFSIPVDWKVPAFETQLQADFARSFARVPELTYEYAHGWHWLRPWFRELVR